MKRCFVFRLAEALAIASMNCRVFWRFAALNQHAQSGLPVPRARKTSEFEVLHYQFKKTTYGLAWSCGLHSKKHPRLGATSAPLCRPLRIEYWVCLDNWMYGV